MSYFSRKALRWRCENDGYTLLELIVVLLILALIVSIAAPKVIGHLGRSKARAAEIQISSIMSSLTMYRLDVGSYPSEQQGLKALIERPSNAKNWEGPYLTRRDGIIDPWGNPYAYMPGEGGEKVVVMSYGADAKPGGTGENADMTSDH